MGWVAVGIIYIALVVFFFIYLGPSLFAITGLGFAVWFVVIYIRTLYSIMAVDPSPIATPLAHAPSPTPPASDQPAYRQYFFGQAIADLKHSASVSFARCQDIVERSSTWIRSSFFQNEMVLATWPLGIVSYAGLVSGGVVGGVVLSAIAAIHALVVLILQAIALAVAYTLRLIDTGARRARRISMRCPRCYEDINFPAYDCPATSCSIRHGDVRPGRYGVLRRSCACMTRMPTLIILGSHRLDAYCPHCDSPLAEGVGTAAEVVLPVMGGTAAGKTRLMASMVMALDEMADEHGAQLVFADAETKREYERIRPLLVAGESTRATQVGQGPRAYSVYVAPKSGRRKLVHIFDPAGELHNETERMQELRYIRAARSFLFVVDPLSISDYWRGLTDAERSSFAQDRPDQRLVKAPEFVFQTSYDNIMRMGVNTKRSRLAVAITKQDVVGSSSLQASVEPNSDRIEAWLRDELGLGNMLRSMRLNFGDVAFFFSAAVRVNDGVDRSVVDIVRWLLAGERLYLGDRSHAPESTFSKEAVVPS